MKKTRVILAVVMTVLMMASMILPVLGAPDTNGGNRQIVKAVKTTTAITVDGDLDAAWNTANVIELKDADKNISATIRLMWDANGLYAFVELNKNGRKVFDEAGRSITKGSINRSFDDAVIVAMNQSGTPASDPSANDCGDDSSVGGWFYGSASGVLEGCSDTIFGDTSVIKFASKKVADDKVNFEWSTPWINEAKEGAYTTLAINVHAQLNVDFTADELSAMTGSDRFADLLKFASADDPIAKGNTGGSMRHSYFHNIVELAAAGAATPTDTTAATTAATTTAATPTDTTAANVTTVADATTPAPDTNPPTDDSAATTVDAFIVTSAVLALAACGGIAVSKKRK